MYKVMLAKVFNPDKHDPTGWMMSEKLDGVRAYWDGEKLWSRGGKVFAAPSWFTKGFPDFHLDGELWLGRETGDFDRASGIVRRKEGGNDWMELMFKVFDAPTLNGGFKNRLLEAGKYLDKTPSCSFASLHEHEVCQGLEHLYRKLDEVIEAGGEGVMLREGNSPYVNGRSSWLLKVKKMLEGRAMVYDIQEGTGKYEGMMGALLVYWIDENDETIATFKIGTGFSDDERSQTSEKKLGGNIKSYWVGKVVAFRYQEATVDGVPRFPSFVRILE
jgi:DNA ligase-1